MLEKQNERKNWIDAAKAVAIFVVVLNHSGLVIPGVNFWGGMFFVPAFFVLSGYTYHVSEGSFGNFLKRKAKRILLPYLAANVLLFLFSFCLQLWKRTAPDVLIKEFVPTSLAGMVYGRNCLFPERASTALMINLNAPTWFLPALFAVLAIMEGLFRLFRGDEKKILAVILVYALAGVGYHYFCPLLLPWCLDVIPFFLLMMYAGFRLKKTNAIESAESVSVWKRMGTVFVLLVALIVSGLINGSVNLSLSNTGKSITLMLISAVSSSILLMVVMHLSEKFGMKLTNGLAAVGRHTLTILCYHYFVLSWSMTIGLLLLGGEISNPVFSGGFKVICILFSIAVCVIADLTWERIWNRNRMQKHEG